MSTPSQHHHAYNNTKRHRTPRVVRVVQEGSANLVVYFDRPMDQLKETFTIRTVDEVNGVVDWKTPVTPGTAWIDRWTLNTDNVEVVDPSYTGPRFAVYMSGDLRAQGRYPLLNGDRCERVEDV